MNLADRRVLVTGASSGIGRATAMLLADRGADVLVAGRDPSRVAEVAAATSGVPLVYDLADPGATDEFARTLVGQQIDVVVHSAGLGLVSSAHEVDDVDVRRLMQVNLLAPMTLTRAVLPGMREQGGRIAFVTSVAGLLGVGHESAYAASKAALGTYADSLRAELAGTRVGVTVLAPALVETEFFARRGVPHGRSVPRPLDPEQVARALVTAIEHERTELLLPRWLRVAVALRASIPWAYNSLASRLAG